MGSWLVGGIIITSSLCLLQEDGVRAKELFYRGAPQDVPSSKKGPSNPKRPSASPPQKTPSDVGLKISIELRMADGSWVLVKPTRPFYSEDRIRVHVESNTAGRLTILQKQDREKPDLLFPDPRLSGGDDRVRESGEIVIPLAFDDQPGVIEISVLLQPETPNRAPGIAGTDTGKAVAEIERVSRSKGLRVDVDESGSPAVFAVRPGKNEKEPQVAYRLLLDHRPKGRAQRP